MPRKRDDDEDAEAQGEETQGFHGAKPPPCADSPEKQRQGCANTMRQWRAGLPRGHPRKCVIQ